MLLLALPLLPPLLQLLLESRDLGSSTPLSQRSRALPPPLPPPLRLPRLRPRHCCMRLLPLSPSRPT